jgi:hypothetical protein
VKIITDVDYEMLLASIAKAEDGFTRLLQSHAALLAAAKKVMDRNPVPRGARRVEFDELADAITAAGHEPWWTRDQ